MNSAPEKIYIFDQSKDGRYGTWNAVELEDTECYIHADLVPQWLPIDSAIKSEEEIYVADDKNQALVTWFSWDGSDFGSWQLVHCGSYASDGSLDFTPTHWMRKIQGPT